MKYLSIDVETTGIDPEFNQILSIGIIIEDSTNPLPYEQVPKFHCAIKYDEVYGSLFALNMNKELISSINSYMIAKNDTERKSIENETGMIFLHKNEVVKHIMYFLYDNGFVPRPNVDNLSHAAISNSYTQSKGNLYPIIQPNMEKIYLTCAGKNVVTLPPIIGDGVYLDGWCLCDWSICTLTLTDCFCFCFCVLDFFDLVFCFLGIIYIRFI